MRVIIWFGFLLFLLGCDPSSHQGVPEHFSKPFYGDWGIDLSNRNEDVDLQRLFQNLTYNMDFEPVTVYSHNVEVDQEWPQKTT